MPQLWNLAHVKNMPVIFRPLVIYSWFLEEMWFTHLGLRPRNVNHISVRCLKKERYASVIAVILVLIARKVKSKREAQLKWRNTHLPHFTLIYCNICSKSKKNSSRELMPFTMYNYKENWEKHLHMWQIKQNIHGEIEFNRNSWTRK